MFGMTLAFATAGIAQVYLERIIGLGYLETQRKIQVHFLMLVATGLVFALGVALFLWDFFVLAAAAAVSMRRCRAERRRRGGTRRRLRPAEWMAASACRAAVSAAPRRRIYLPTGDEVEIFEPCHARGLPVMLKGPTGCGKTRFVEYMAWRLRRPLVTIACHDDLSASDLIGRYLVAAARRSGRTGR